MFDSNLVQNVFFYQTGGSRQFADVKKQFNEERELKT
jgi:hypothetical protein